MKAEFTLTITDKEGTVFVLSETDARQLQKILNEFLGEEPPLSGIPWAPPIGGIPFSPNPGHPDNDVVFTHENTHRTFGDRGCEPPRGEATTDPYGS